MQARQKLEFEINNSDLVLDELEVMLKNEYSELVGIERVRARRGENEIIDHFIWKKSMFKKEYSLILVKGELIKLPAQTFEEVVADVIIDYQKVYERKMVREWEKSYKVWLNKKLLKRL